MKDSDHFHSEHCIWPVGYSAVRKFVSVSGVYSCVASYVAHDLGDPF